MSEPILREFTDHEMDVAEMVAALKAADVVMAQRHGETFPLDLYEKAWTRYAEAILASLPAQAVEPDPGLAAIAGHSCPQCRRVNSRNAAQAVEPDDIVLRRLPNPPYDVPAQPVEPGPLDVEAPEGWRWECVSCDRPVSPMGMCETCGVFGVMRIAEDAR